MSALRAAAQPCVASRPQLKARAVFSRPAARMTVRASAQKQETAAPAVALASTSAVAALLASPLAAQAAVTPSLQNFFYSLLAGATVLAAIAGAITLVSNFDPVNRA